MNFKQAWMLAISRYEGGGQRLSPYEGTVAGFMQCFADLETNIAAREVLNNFTDITFSSHGISKEWTQQKQACWIFALHTADAIDNFQISEAGCLEARRLMFEGSGDLRELAVLCWTEFTKAVMKI